MRARGTNGNTLLNLACSLIACTTPGVEDAGRLTPVTRLLAAGADPAKGTLFIQAQGVEHAELHLLLSMVKPPASGMRWHTEKLSHAIPPAVKGTTGSRPFSATHTTSS